MENFLKFSKKGIKKNNPKKEVYDFFFNFWKKIFYSEKTWKFVNFSKKEKKLEIFLNKE